MTEYQIHNDKEMIQLGQQVANTANKGLLIYLYGDLGTGKTTFCRGFIQARGHQGNVKSPTYTLVESYDLTPMVYHFDLYRLADPSELDYLGLADYLHEPVIWLIEWPAQGGDYLPTADISIHLDYHGTERQVDIQAHTDKGKASLSILSPKT